MPFASIQYRTLRSSPLGWQQRRNRFLCWTLTYAGIFLAIGVVFLALFITKNNQLNGYSCQEVCSYLGTPFSCGPQQCCDSPNGDGSYYYNSYMFCLGDYAQSIYFIIMICCFGYVAYEVFLILCLLCTGSALRSGTTDMIVVNGYQNRPQFVGLTTNYNNPYPAYPNYSPNAYNQQPQPIPNQGNVAPNPLNNPPKEKESAKVIINDEG